MGSCRMESWRTTTEFLRSTAIFFSGSPKCANCRWPCESQGWASRQRDRARTSGTATDPGLIDHAGHFRPRGMMNLSNETKALSHHSRGCRAEVISKSVLRSMEPFASFRADGSLRRMALYQATDRA